MKIQNEAHISGLYFLIGNQPPKETDKYNAHALSSVMSEYNPSKTFENSLKD